MQTAITLPHRRVIRFVGKDTKTFIQGLFSNDVLQLDPGTVPIIYGAFLNGNGRVVTDGFVFYDEKLLSNKDHSPSQEVFVEVDKAHTQKLITHLEAFKMRSEVSMSVMDDVQVQAAIVAPAEEAEAEKMEAEGKATSKLEDTPAGDLGDVFTDPRKSLENVRRIYTHVNKHHNTDEPASSGEDTTAVRSYDEYLIHLYERGIAEGETLWSHIRLPFEGNLDIIGGVHYQKGCYIGQELVQRAKNQLVTSKRIVPLQSNTTLDAGVELLHPKTNKTVGKVIDTVRKVPAGTSEKYVGVVSLRLADALNPETLDTVLTVKGANNAVKISANVPYWWPDDEIDKCIPIAEESNKTE